MTVEAMSAALAEARAYLRLQLPHESPVETLDELTWPFEIRSAQSAIEGVAALVRDHAATVVLAWRTDRDEEIELIREPLSGKWRSRGAASPTVLEALGAVEDYPEWDDAALAPAFAELDRASGSGRLTLGKQAWRAPLEAAWDRVVWIGPAASGFEQWLMGQESWDELARALLARPGFAVVADDAKPLANGDGRRVELVRPANDPSPALDDTDLAAGLHRLGRGEELPLWRAALLEPGPGLSPAARGRLLGMATAAAAWVLADERRREVGADAEVLRPRRDRARAYAVADRPAELDDRAGAALRALAVWTADELSAARISVAQRIAAAEIARLDDETPAPAVVEAADIAYRVAIDRRVEESLAQQAVFERTFVDLDASVAEIRRDVSAMIDQVVTRTLTGASAFTIAALASPRFRGGAALIAAVLIALFVTANVVLLWRSTRPEAMRRLDDARDEVAVRRSSISAELAAVLTSRLHDWRDAVKTRIAGGTAILVALVVALLAVGGYVAHVTDYDSGSPAPACTCHVKGPQATCTCRIPR